MSRPAPVRLAVIGAGMIGHRHAAAIAAAEGAVLACVVDPAEAGQRVAARHGVPCHPSIEAMVAAGGVDGAYLATPNQVHVEGALACLAAGLPLLVEKPIATDVAGGRRIVAAAEAAGLPLATGHHRRHNPLIARARALVAEGRIGQPVTVHGTTWFMKPDYYFDDPWRRQAGAGPVFLNLIHDIDLLQSFCGRITEVSAMEARPVRGYAPEEAAVMILRFETGVLGTVSVCDTVVAPWSWEMTARENPAYPATPEDCYRIAGTLGSLSLPNLALWTDGGARDWWQPISATRMAHDLADPLVAQAAQFARVIRDGEAPVVSGRDGLAALAVIEAVKRSAANGARVRVDHDPAPGAGLAAEVAP